MPRHPCHACAAQRFFSDPLDLHPQARIWQLELEKMRPPPSALFSSPTAGPNPSRPAVPTLQAPHPSTSAAGTSAPPSDSPTAVAPLVLLDFSPEWDETCGGAKMLLTAETRPGCSYAARFGEVLVGAYLVQPNVLRLYVPAAPGGRVGDIMLRLLCISPRGQVLQESGPAQFVYRTAFNGGGHRHGPTPPQMLAPPLRNNANSHEPSPHSTPSAATPHMLRSPGLVPMHTDLVAAAAPPAAAAAVSSSASASAAAVASPFGAVAFAATSPPFPASTGSSLCSSASSSFKQHCSLADDREEGLLRDGLDRSGGCHGGGDDGGGGGGLHGGDAAASEAEADSLFAMALSLTSGPESELEQHFIELIGALGEDDVTQLCRLQRAVRHRLRDRAGPTGLPSVQEMEAGIHERAGSDVAAISRVQRTFRSRRRQRIDTDSRRRAALAIERFYLKRHRGGGPGPTLAQLRRLQSADGGVSPRGATSPVRSADDDVTDVTDVGVGLITRAQAAFRARQARKQAVRRIEQCYTEWKYHAEQANLAAQGVRDSGAAPGDADTSLLLHSCAAPPPLPRPSIVFGPSCQVHCHPPVALTPPPATGTTHAAASALRAPSRAIFSSSNSSTPPPTPTRRSEPTARPSQRCR